MSDTQDQQALNILRHHARSFSWGGFFLPRQQLLQAARLYHFCRVCDDLADLEGEQELARSELRQVQASLRAAAQGQRPAFQPVYLQAFLATAAETGMQLHFAESLIEGLLQDIAGPRIETLGDLLHYCYQVAGTVGGMMCPILGVQDPEALPFAVDLGIAMQLTNICRDVREDAENQRVYLPESLLQVYGLSQRDLLLGQVSARRLAPVVQALLNLAERYYQSGFAGMVYIPSRARLAILVAARVYRGIGLKIAAADYDSWSGRQILSPGAKALQVLQALGQFPTLSSRAASGRLLLQPRHDAELHAPLPGAVTRAMTPSGLLPGIQP